MHEFIGAIDQGTSSSRFLIFDTESSCVVAKHQIELTQSFPESGWVEMDPIEILTSVNKCMKNAVEEFTNGGRVISQIKSIGITNQRETLIIWNKETGLPLCNAIVWMDTRASRTCARLIKEKGGGDKDCLRNKCGLPISPYFTGPKLKWAMDHMKDIRRAIKENSCYVGTVDTWLIWNLMGGARYTSAATAASPSPSTAANVPAPGSSQATPTSGSGRSSSSPSATSAMSNYITDVTNASRTMFMNLKTLQWDAELCKFFDIPMSILPKIVNSSDYYGSIAEGHVLAGVSITGILGDQQAALVGQRGFTKGVSKNTYGTGCFLLFNTGSEQVISSRGLLTTVAYKFGQAKPVYALEGSVAVAGAVVKWLQDNLGIIEKSSDIEKIAAKCDTTEGVYFVPTFTGAFCPYWRDDARGSLVGLSHTTRRQHICRAALNSVAFQTEEILLAFEADTGCQVKTLLADGGMTSNQLFMQIQADISGIDVQTRDQSEATAFGVALAAAKCLNIEFSADQSKQRCYSPRLADSIRRERFLWWKKAVDSTFGWSAAATTTKEDRSDEVVKETAKKEETLPYKREMKTKDINTKKSDNLEDSEDLFSAAAETRCSLQQYEIPHNVSSYGLLTSVTNTPFNQLRPLPQTVSAMGLLSTSPTNVLNPSPSKKDADVDSATQQN